MKGTPAALLYKNSVTSVTSVTATRGLALQAVTECVTDCSVPIVSCNGVQNKGRNQNSVTTPLQVKANSSQKIRTPLQLRYKLNNKKTNLISITCNGCNGKKDDRDILPKGHVDD